MTMRLDSMVRRICPGLGIDLVDLPVPVLAHPERAFGPGKSGIAAFARRRDGGEHLAGLRIDLLDAILGDLEQMFAVEGGSGMCSDIDRPNRLAAHRIEGFERVPGGKPDVLAVKGDAVHPIGSRKRAILAEDFGCGSFHAVKLATRQGAGE